MVSTNTHNLYEANRQWATRPQDQRFWDLNEMLEVTRSYHRTAVTRTATADQLDVQPVGDDVVITSKSSNAKAAFSHFSFGQFSRLLGAPAEYLRQLPANLVADNLRHGLRQRADSDNRMMKMLMRRDTNNTLRVRSFTSEMYSRIWDDRIVERLIPMQQHGWKVPPARPCGNGDPRQRPATKNDILRLSSAKGLGIKVGDPIAPAGLYASDKDLFVFMVNEDHTINLGKDHPTLSRGFFIENSEVGDRAFKVTAFLYNSVCGNHIVWGVQDLVEIRVIHRGDDAEGEAFTQLRMEVTNYLNTADCETKQIKRAIEMKLGSSPEEVIDLLFGKRVAPKCVLVDGLRAAQDHPEDHGGSSPLSVWGLTNGLTRISQDSQYQDQRVEIDRAASKVMAMAF